MLSFRFNQAVSIEMMYIVSAQDPLKRWPYLIFSPAVGALE